MIATYVAFAAQTQLTPMHRPTLFSGVWIRVAYAECESLEESLCEARPMKGEILLNSFSFDTKQGVGI